MSESSASGSSSDLSLGMKLTVKGIRAKFSSVKDITTDSLATWLQSTEQDVHEKINEEKVILLDARPVEEYSISHIENAIRVEPSQADVSEVIQRIKEIQTEQPIKAVVCYCSVGYRSSQLAERLQSAAGEDLPMPVYNLEGSLFKWANEGRPMVDNQGQKTIYAHPYNAVWGKLLNKNLRQYKLDTKS